MSPSDFQFRSITADTPIRPKILVVEDQPVNIQLLHPVFAADCQVFMATSGEQALKLSREHLPDLILLDVVMPGDDGFEVLKRIRRIKSQAELPVMMVVTNNGYGISTPAKGQHGEVNIADRGHAFGIPGEVVDGNDPVASLGLATGVAMSC